jgi:hypothetical protein
MTDDKWLLTLALLQQGFEQELKDVMENLRTMTPTRAEWDEVLRKRCSRIIADRWKNTVRDICPRR